METCKEAIARVEHAIDALYQAMERGFAEQRTALDEQKAAVVALTIAFAEQKTLLAEQKAALAEHKAATERQFTELRKEMDTRFRWVLGLIFTNMTFTFGILIHLTRII